jgi:poly(A) polymerase
MQRLLRDAAAGGQLADVVERLRKQHKLHLVLPEVYWMLGVEQSPEYHQEGDVYQHTLLVVRAAKPDPTQQWAALLHDVGKSLTRGRHPDGRISFIGHELAGADLVPGVLLRFGYDDAFVDQVQHLVANHMKPHQGHHYTKRALRRFVRRQGQYLEALLDLADADAAGSFRREGHHAKPDTSVLRDRIAALDPEPPPPRYDTLPLSGHDIMRILHIPPGPKVGAAKRWLLAQPGVHSMTTEQAELLLRNMDT